MNKEKGLTYDGVEDLGCMKRGGAFWLRASVQAVQVAVQAVQTWPYTHEGDQSYPGEVNLKVEAWLPFLP